MLPRWTSRQWLLAVAVLCAASIGLALLAQYRFGMEPCPYCILQRLLYAAIGVLALIGAVLPGMLRKLLAVVALLLSACAAAAAVYQHFVAAKSASCALTFADKIITALRIDEFAPSLFAVRASCADAAVSVFGVPFEFWSLLLALLLAAMTVLALRSR
ncbi:disulfide bond formation protein B [Piscinibacter terrae]|uniref:Disulfide bond formation protein B n=1 Tax=Piscinibacter terrae TaxID=2496871 RepID=A0A3N7HP26_9BURK|nr:disulfide bond formation protein B [Albitalea terrae]RQP23880.1 disulfide bond formation protein B [Albitalea terrae]